MGGCAGDSDGGLEGCHEAGEEGLKIGLNWDLYS